MSLAASYCYLFVVWQCLEAPVMDQGPIVLGIVETQQKGLCHTLKENLRWVQEKNFPESKVPGPTSKLFTALQTLGLSLVVSSVLFIQHR